MKTKRYRPDGANLKRAAIWLAVVSVWGYSELAAAACATSMAGAVDQNVSAGACVFAPTVTPNAAVTIDGETGPSMVTAAGNNTYADTFIGLPGVAPYGTFIRVAPTLQAIQDAQLTMNGNQTLSVSAATVADGMDVAAYGVPHNAKVLLIGANLDLNVGSRGAIGIHIVSDSSSSAIVALTNSSVNIDTGGIYGISMQGALSALTSSGTQNALTIGTVLAPTAAALYIMDGATVDVTGRINFNSHGRGVEVYTGSVFHLDGTDSSQSAINVTGASGYALGVNYQSTDATGELKNATVNMSGPTSVGFNINVNHGALDLQHVRLTSDMIDGSALTLSGGAVTGSGLAIDVNGKGTGGIDVEPNANAQITLDGTIAGNTIVTRGGTDSASACHVLPYCNAAGVRLLGGSIGMASTDVETYGNGAPGIYLGKGTLSTGAGVSIHTHGDGADGIVYTPFGGDTTLVTTAFSSATSVQTDGGNAYGFVADGLDPYDGTGTPHPFTLQFGSTGLSASAIAVQGAGSAAIGARNGATLVLTGQNLGVLAGLPSGTYAVEAESGGKVQFTVGTSAGGAAVFAGSGGTLDFNDDSASASQSLVAIAQGSSVNTRGELDLSGRTQVLNVGQLASVGSASVSGLVNLGGNGLTLDGNSATPAVFSGAIEGAGGLLKLGTGVQVLSGGDVFDYTGATQIRGGTLAVAGGAVARDANGFKLLSIGSGGTLDIGNNQGTFEAGAISGFGIVHLTDSATGASSNLVLEGTGSSSSFSGMIDGSGGVVLRGSAAQTFSGSSVFGFTGDVTLGGGSLKVVGNAQAAGTRFVFDDGANTGGTLDISGNGAAGFSAAGIDAANPATTAQIALGSSSGSARNIVLGGSGNYSFNGTISGYGNVVKQGTGTQTMSGIDPFGFNGTTVIQGGVLQLRNIVNPSQLNESFVLDGGWLDLSDSTFDTAGQNANDWVQLHVIDGSQAANGGIIGGDDKVTLGSNSGDSVEAAQIDNGVFVVKTGTNTLTLTGTNTYVGNTRILGGTLKVSSDANLGSTTYEREVILDGGNLEIAGGGNFTSSRQLQLRAAGAVQVDGDASASATLGSIAGSGQTFTKSGGGALTLTRGGSVGQVVVADGALDLRSTHVDATTLSVAGQAAITQGTGTTVSLDGGAVTSQGDAIVANGTSTLNLSNNTQITAGGAAYRVTSGTGTLNASGETLTNNVLEADGAGSTLAVNLSNGSSYTGTPTLTGGAAATLSIDGSSRWNMTSNTELAGLKNLGTITFGTAGIGGTVGATAVVAKAATSFAYQTLTVNGDYQGGGTLNMRTELNAGGTLSNQHTDRLIVMGDASGQTALSLATSGTGANTNTANNGQAVPTEGISLVQVKGASNAGAFTLKGGYVAAQGSPYQYRIFAHGPGSNGVPAASQSLLPDGTTPQWDYRLQTSYVDGTGHVQPGPGPQCCARPSVVPQGSSDLSVPLALQNYETVITDGLYRRLGDARHGAFDQPGSVADVFARTIDSRSMYHSNRGFNEYGYDFGQYVTAVQFGADWLHRKREDEDFRLGTAVTLGHSSVFPRAVAVESSSASIDAYHVALTGTWQRRDGWYADGVLSAGWYTGTIDTSQHGEAGRISANGLDGSLEVGRSFALAHGIEIEPHARMLAQLLHFQGRKDNDGIDARTGDLLAVTGLLGVQASMTVPDTVSFRPYVRIDFAYTQMNSPDVTLSGQSFAVGRPGAAMQIGVGANGIVTPNFSIYGELSGQQRLGRGMSTLAATLGLRYAF